MDWNEAQARIAAGEDERTEFKEASSSSSLDKVAVAASALANSDGGVVFLGVDDERRIVGVPRDPEEVQEELANLLANRFNVPLPARPGRHQSPTGWVHWIEVPRYRGPEPVRYRGRVHVRHGRSSVEASPAELQELYNVFGFILTEERVI